MSDWDLRPGSWKDGSSSMAQKAEDLILRNPEWVVYVRKDARFRCPWHWDESSETPVFADPNCPKCAGFGTKVSFELVPCRIERDRGTMGPMDGEQRNFPGYIESDGVVFDAPRWVSPQKEDLVFVCEWGVPASRISEIPRARPLRLVDAYLVKKTNAYFEREMAFVNCGLELYPLEDEKMSRIVELIPDLRARTGKRSAWQAESYW